MVSLKEGLFTNANVLFRARFRDGTSVVEVGEITSIFRAIVLSGLVLAAYGHPIRSRSTSHRRQGESYGDCREEWREEDRTRTDGSSTTGSSLTRHDILAVEGVHVTACCIVIMLRRWIAGQCKRCALLVTCGPPCVYSNLSLRLRYLHPRRLPSLGSSAASPGWP